VRAGVVAGVDAMTVALAALRLGAGRIKAEDTVDHAAGFTRLAKVGERIAAGDVLGVVHASDSEQAAVARTALESAITLADAAPGALPLIVERI